MQKYIIRIFFILLPLQAVAADPAQMIIDAYQTQCPHSVTDQVRVGIGSINVMRNLINELKVKDKCTGISGVLTQADSFYRTYERYLVYEEEKYKKRAIEKEIELFTRHINNPAVSAADKQMMQTEIYLSQAKLIDINGRFSRFTKMRGDQANKAHVLVNSVNTFMEGLATVSSECLDSNKHLFSSLIQNTLMGVSAFVNPGTGLALATGSIITNSIDQWLTTYTYNDFVRELDTVKLPVALSCVSEALSEQYCAADEMEIFLTNYEKEEDKGEEKSHYRGINLLSYHLDNLDEWLNLIQGGSDPESEGDLINRQKPNNQAHFIKNVKDFLGTFGRIEKEKFKQLDEDRKRSTIAQQITMLRVIMKYPSLTPSGRLHHQPDSENAIFQTYTEKSLEFLIVGQSERPVCKSSETDGGYPCNNFLEWTESKFAAPAFTDVINLDFWDKAVKRAIEIADKILKVVEQRRDKLNIIDPAKIISKVSSGLGETTALEGLRKIVSYTDYVIDFLHQVGCENYPYYCKDNKITSTNPYYFRYVNTVITKDLTGKIYNLINAYQSNPAAESKVIKKLLPKECKAQNKSTEESFDPVKIKTNGYLVMSCLSKLLNLSDRGSQVFISKVREIVNYEMEARLRHGKFADEVLEVARLTTVDYVDSLETSFNNNSVQNTLSIRKGYQEMKRFSKSSYIKFFDFFEEQIYEAFDKNELGELATNAFCFRLLPYLDEKKQDLFEYIYNKCQYADMKYTIKSGGPLLVWRDYAKKVIEKGTFGDDEDFKLKKSFKDRFCAVSDFNLQVDLLKMRRKFKREKMRRGSR